MTITFHKIAGRPYYAIFGEDGIVGHIDCPLEGMWRVRMGPAEKDGFSSAGKARAWVEGYIEGYTTTKEAPNPEAS